MEPSALARSGSPGRAGLLSLALPPATFAVVICNARFMSSFAQILLKNSEIEPSRKSRFRARCVTSADTSYGRACAFIDKALQASEGIAGLSAAMRGLIAARTAVMTAVAAIDADMRRMARASAACSRRMTMRGVGQLTALAFVAAIDDPSRIRRSRDVGAGIPAWSPGGMVDYVGGISKCGDRRVRTLLYEAANVMLTRYKGQLKLKDWAFAIAKRSTMRKARSSALARRLGIIMHAMLRDGTEFEIGLAPRNRQDRRPNLAPR